ncbi:MAG: APC family permease [Coriobacteriia bacterium]|nr:APC family permease [Coriobacteriia bacterium]
MKNKLLGKPLDSDGLERTKLNWFWGFSTLTVNAVSSVAYAIEEILLVLIPVIGVAAILLTPNIALPILVLLLVLVFSYSQIIKHYPRGASAYRVASTSLGKRPAIVAAAAQIIDYVLTVALSMSAAAAALTSAFPQLTPYRILLAIAGILLVTLLNLRGSQESSRVFGIPTYVFILVMAALVATGLFKLVTGTLEPLTYTHLPPVVGEIDPILPIAMVFLLLRAFASGSMVFSGIDGVSTSMVVLRKPRQKNAQIILFVLAGVIILLFGGTVLLARALEVMPIIDPATGMPAAGSLTVIAQMGKAVFGADSALFFILQVSTALVLFLAAYSSYSDLPNLLSILARDNYAPHQFAEFGARLTLSNGIIFLSVAAIGIILLFNARVHAIIPLYSVGVFLSFTISQLGMCVKWMREKEPHWQKRMIINAVGTSMTGIGVVVVFVAKFNYGAWILAIAIPLLCLIMYRINNHYRAFSQSLKIKREDVVKHYHPRKSIGVGAGASAGVGVSTIDATESAAQTELNAATDIVAAGIASNAADSDEHNQIACYVLANSLTRAVLKNINFANQLSDNVHLLHVARDKSQAKRLKRQLAHFRIDVSLIVLDSPYRDLTTPIVNFLDEKESKLKSGQSIAVIMSRFTFDHYYDKLLHNQTSYFISQALRDYKDTATITVPYHMNLQRIRDSYVQPHKE